jgi:hypothetical protein
MLNGRSIVATRIIYFSAQPIVTKVVQGQKHIDGVLFPIEHGFLG